MADKAETARCKDCGAVLALVGRSHLCNPVHNWKGAGRKPLGRRAMTAAERQRRSRKSRPALSASHCLLTDWRPRLIS